MIIVKLIGGLGNQMFQYALGKHLSKKNNADLKLDIFNFYSTEDTFREYSLNVFNIKENFALKKEIKKNKISNFLEKLKPIRLRLVITKEQHSHFDSKILKLIGNIYLDGYWQSEKYFKNIENSIRKEFTLKNDLQLKAKKLLRKIKNTESISIHIRRNDYISHKPANQYHGVCHLSYYKKAINVIIKKIDDPHFFVFSDDIDWCKKNLKIKFPTIFVEGNKDYEDLILMSKCKHNIIANSTFSWWGAWLNNNPNKIVIAPKKWFRKKSINTKDLIPKTWIKI